MIIFLLPLAIILGAWFLISNLSRKRPLVSDLQPREKDHIRGAALWLSVAAYAFSLSQVGYYVDRYETGFRDDIGFSLVFWGAFKLLDGGVGLIWLANPIIWFSWRNASRPKTAFIAATVAAAVCLSFLLIDGYQGGCDGTDFSAMPCYVGIRGYGAGYYFWTLSALIMATGNGIRIIRARKSHTAEV